jgi:asparagine synthase (glutamine-hydrolysing)
MSGITGFINKDKSNTDIDKLKKMTDSIIHRGPNAEAHLCVKNIALGHRTMENRPMQSTNSEFAIVCNGEIYNRNEIKKELNQYGAKFHNETDSDIIIESYRFWGADCLNKFNGVWAFVLWDRIKNQLFISRDRFAVKPLYILDRSDIFMFASEAKAILATEPDENIPDLISVYRYITQSVPDTVDERSWYENIKIFPAASYALYNLETHEYIIKKFWEPDYQKFYEKWIKGKKPFTTFKDLFDNAVGIRLPLGGNVGTCLSGGLDSSAVVGCCNKAHDTTVKTFSSCFEDKDCDEREYINAANRFYKTIPHMVFPDSSPSGFADDFKKIIHHMDAPPSSASLYAQYKVYEEVGKHVSVVLNGQGSDELFGGYEDVLNPYLRKLIEGGSRLKAMKATSDIMSESIFFDFNGVSTDVAVRIFGLSNIEKLMIKMQKNASKSAYYIRMQPRCTEAFQNSAGKTSYTGMLTDFPDEISRIGCKHLLQTFIPRLCRNEDANAMCFSVEARLPFLDYRIVEFALALDSSHKVNGKWQKWIIRKALKKYLPLKICRRRNKMGFHAPFFRWLRESNEREEFKQIIFSLAERNIVPKQTIESHYETHMNGKANLEGILFRFLVLELWLRTCKFTKIE